MIIKFISLHFFISRSRQFNHPVCGVYRSCNKGAQHKEKCFDIHHNMKLCLQPGLTSLRYKAPTSPTNREGAAGTAQHKKLMLKIEINIDLFSLHARDHLLII